MKVGRLLLRAAVGGFMIGHGTQKLFGWFGGSGLKAQGEQFEKMGLKPGIVQAGAAGAAETLGGAGVLLGYRTPLASAGIVSVMLTAINRVHLKNGPWAHKGGYEYNVVLAAAAVALAESGPGSLSLDALRGKEKSGAKWGLFSLALGAAGAAGAHFLTELRATPQTEFDGASTPVAAPVSGGGPVGANAGAAAATYADDVAAGAPIVEHGAVEDAEAGDSGKQAGDEAASSED